MIRRAPRPTRTDTRFPYTRLFRSNAACKEAAIAHRGRGLQGDVTLSELDDRALVALQGPRAAAVLARLAPGVERLRFMDCKPVALDGVDCLVSRSGYSGEDGYEI